MKILLVEDDKATGRTIAEALSDTYIVEFTLSGEDGDYKAHVNEYDLILLDYILPDINGIEVCKKIRKSGVKTPILIISGNYDTNEKVKALNNGADDYLTKPFSYDELRARIKALLRRSTVHLANNSLSVADLVIDPDSKTVMRSGEEIMLRRKEFDLLEYLVRNVGKIVTRSMILEHVWDSSYESMTNVVDVHIKYLRDRVDKLFVKKLIKTVHGLGYKIEP